jgi:tripartite-type tricarboxylate transporter receptor subunit TctC
MGDSAACRAGRTAMTTWLRVLAAIGGLGFGMAAAQDSAYPSKPIRVIVSNAAGGVTDTLARTIGQRLTEIWGQQVVVENKPGANTQIAAEYVAKSAPDGHTLLMTPEVTFVINPNLYAKLPYDAVKDFIPVTGLVSVNHALVAHPSLPAQSVGELIALAKARPGELNYATLGPGSAAHLNMEMFQSMAGVKLTPVHYRGATPALTDVVGGHVPMMFVNIGSALSAWKGGKVKVLAIASAKRLGQFPELPTVAESGVPGFAAGSWFGLFAPAGTPREVVLRINAEVRRIMADPDYREKVLVPNTLEPITSSPEDYAASIRADTEKWGKVIHDAKLKIE